MHLVQLQLHELVIHDRAAGAFVRPRERHRHRDRVITDAHRVRGELEIAEAQSGFDALRLLPRGAWDLVITDINMPDINGLELIRFIEASRRSALEPVTIIIVATKVDKIEKSRKASALAAIRKHSGLPIVAFSTEEKLVIA